MKKLFLFIVIVCVPISLMAIRKSCNYLNKISYGMTTRQVYEILGEPVAKKKIENDSTIIRYVYILCHFNSVQVTEPYFIDFRNDSAINRGITNHSNSEVRFVPFGILFSEDTDEFNEITSWQGVENTSDVENNQDYQQKLEKLNTLYKQGLITADEYVQWRKALLMQIL